MSFEIGSLGRVGVITGRDQLTRASAFAIALEAYKFLGRHFVTLLVSLLLPMVAAGFVLYVTLNKYLSDLVLFLEVPNPHVASLALGTLAAGLFLSLFCYAIAVSSVCDLTLGKRHGSGRPRLKAQRQEWRIYAAYLRLLLLLSLVFMFAILLWTYFAPRLLISARFVLWMPTILCVFGLVWLIARIGFLIAPVVSGSEGPVLRRAAQMSSRDLLRNCGLIVMLLVPGLLVLVVGGYAFQMGAGPFHAVRNLPLTDSALSVKAMLGAFVTVISLSLFMDIVLLTVGSLAAYQTKFFRVTHTAIASQIDFSLERSVPAEGPPK